MSELISRAVGVRFRQAGKIYHFDPGSLELKVRDKVIVETSRGIEYGEVATIEEAHTDKSGQPLKPIIRQATDEDTARMEENRRKEKDAIRTCKELINKNNLEMKLIACEYTLDNSKMLFYFTADGRVDFRELVKDLAAVFHTRIELRQVGVRDETKILGGYGSCGRPLCCHSYLSDFAPVSIKMAKKQNLSLNTAKISGVCGRLMCCLKNEEEAYEELNRSLPSNGDFVMTPDGLKGVVSAVNILKQRVKVIVDLPNDEKEVRDYAAGEIRFKSRKKVRQAENDAAELKALAELEKKDKAEKSGLDD